MTAKTPVYQLEYLVQGEPVRNTRLALENNAKSIEAALMARGVAAAGAADVLAVSGRVSTLEAGLWTAYTPAWTAGGVALGIATGTLVGKYIKVGRTVHLDIFLQFGANGSTSGGNGGWTFTLPFPAAPGREHYLQSKCWVSNGWNLWGYGLIAGNSSSVSPWMPISPTNVNYEQVRNADSSNASGTGRPLVPSAYTFGANSNLMLSGRYEAAS